MEIFLDLFLVMVRLLPMEAAFLAAFFLVDLEALKSSSSEEDSSEDSLSDGAVLSLCWIQSKRWGERRALVNYERTRQHCLSK